MLMCYEPMTGFFCLLIYLHIKKMVIIILWEMLTCALKTQDKEPNIVTFCWNVCIQFNFLIYNK